MTLCLYPAQYGSVSPHFSQIPLLILITADAWPRAWAGIRVSLSPPWNDWSCVFGAVENSCLGLQGLSPSYFHL